MSETTRPARFVRAHLSFLFLFLLLLASFVAPVVAQAGDNNKAEVGLDETNVPPADATPVDATGVLSILAADDFEHGKSKSLYVLEDKEDKGKFNIRFQSEIPKGLQSGATVRIRGRAKGKELYLAAEGGDSTVQVLAPAAAVVAGEQQTLVMVVDFADSAVTCPVSAVQDLMFTDPSGNSVDRFFRETSFGQVSFSGVVAGPYMIDARSTDACNPGAWADAADAAAVAENIDLSAYPRKVYVLPSTNNCGFAGLGQVGGSPSRAWTFRCDVVESYAHELGHNLGMGHASTPTGEYGDTSDVMGSLGGGLRQVNSAHKQQMGWVPSAQVLPVTESGIYQIAPLEFEPSQVKAPQTIKIQKPDTGEYYYLSYRLPTGFDSKLAYTYLRRLTVHRYAGDGTAARTYLLQTLADGGTFTDSGNDISITQLSHDDSQVTVQILFGSATCQVGAPSLAVTPVSQSGAPGATLGYAVSVTNMDRTGCPESTFNLASTLPLGWSGGVSPGVITLAPGESGLATLSTSSAATAAAGTYKLTVSAADSGTPDHGSSAVAEYVVSAPCSRSAPSLTVSPMSQTGAAGATLRYSISVTNEDETSCASSAFSLVDMLPGDWSGSVSPATLSLAPGQTGSASLTVTSADNATAGDYGIGVSVADAAVSGHGSSREVTYTVYVPTVPADTQPPTQPTGFTATVKRNQVKLAWDAASDNVGVAGYDLWRDGVLIASMTKTSYTENLRVAGSYTYSVVARDVSGNASSPSNSVSVMVDGRLKGGGKGH